MGPSQRLRRRSARKRLRNDILRSAGEPIGDWCSPYRPRAQLGGDAVSFNLLFGGHGRVLIFVRNFF